MIRLERVAEDRFIFQPGNGSRYDVIIRRVTLDVMDPQQSGWLCCYLRTGSSGPCMIFLDDTILHYNYFLEKMEMGKRPADAAALLSLIHEVTGKTCVLPPGFDANGNPDYAHPERTVVLERKAA